MLILVPILLLLILALTIFLLGRYKLSTGSTWLVTAGSVLLVWIILLVFRAALPGGVTINNWSPLGIGSDLLVFKLSSNTWIYAFLLVSLLIGVIFTDTVRLGQGNNLTTWTGSMVLTAVGLLSIYSQTLLTIIITWSIIDIVEFGILFSVIKHPRVHSAAVLEFAIRILGTTLILGALVFSNSHSFIAESVQYSQAVYVLILLGATMRLGVLPLHVPLTANLPVRRGLGTMLRFVAPFSVLSFLSQFQFQQQFLTITNIFIPIALIIAFYGSIKWLVAKNELTGRSYWMLAFSGLVLISFLRGQPEGVVALSIVMIICGGFVFLHSFSAKIVTGVGVICLFGLIGFPYTPAESLWMSLIRPDHLFQTIILILTKSILFLGFLKHLTRNRDQLSLKEIWAQLFYSIGLGLLAVIPWITLIWRDRSIQYVQNWSSPLISMGFIFLLFFIVRSKIGQKIWADTTLQRFVSPGITVGKLLGTLFQFDWFFFLLRKVYEFITRPIKFFSNILEGDGGLLWALLFLALLSSFLIEKPLP